MSPSQLHGCTLMFYIFIYVLYVLPPVSSVPGGGAQDAGGALVGPSL